MPRDLGALIDHGLRNNPSTRVAWSRARAAAAAAGEARAPYFPRIAVRFEGGSDRWYTPSANAPDDFTRVQATTIFSIEYLLLDFGRRAADIRRTLAALDAAGFLYERKLQEVVFEVQRTYFAHEAALRQADAASAMAEAARAMLETVRREVDAGLSAIPELRAAQKELRRAEYEQESALAAIQTSQGDLCVAAGLPADTRLDVAKSGIPPSTAELRAKASALIDGALASRPDLASRAAEVREREASARRAKADFLPEVRLEGRYGYSAYGYEARAGETGGRYSQDINGYGAFLVAKWDLFDGFERVERLRRKKAETQAAREELELARLEATRDVWTACQNSRSAASRVEYAESFVASAEETHDAVRAAFEGGLATVSEYSEAAAELAQARSERASAVAEYSTSLAALAFATGVPARGAVPPGAPSGHLSPER